MEKVIYKTETGISIITPTNSGLAIFDIEEIAQKDIPRILPVDKQLLWNEGKMSREEYSTYPLPEYKIIDESELPQDRTFRNAWNYDLKEDLATSKEIWKEKLRIERKPLLEALDVDYMKALEVNDIIRQGKIIAEKQVLRDITNLVDGAETINQIKVITIEKPVEVK